ncbi:hypothetical protein FNV43_RR16939 [Rhamnella rubrinervis]|uniref:Uncharacterized protein n=1 Tax=Rhamnella rubrinervis TaxID=2594499 RepID=A0A8K0ME80_9ROSA|nr:hypothetical protein FNV43_RR16939 [Rhamnella rubrinervis]
MSHSMIIRWQYRGLQCHPSAHERSSGGPPIHSSQITSCRGGPQVCYLLILMELLHPGPAGPMGMFKANSIGLSRLTLFEVRFRLLTLAFPDSIITRHRSLQRLVMRVRLRFVSNHVAANKDFKSFARVFGMRKFRKSFSSGYSDESLKDGFLVIGMGSFRSSDRGMKTPI